MQAVMERRKLTDEEKERVKAWGAEKAHLQHPRARVTVSCQTPLTIAALRTLPR
jgi:hypothetical protein